MISFSLTTPHRNRSLCLLLMRSSAAYTWRNWWPDFEFTYRVNGRGGVRFKMFRLRLNPLPVSLKRWGSSLGREPLPLTGQRSAWLTLESPVGSLWIQSRHFGNGFLN